MSYDTYRALVDRCARDRLNYPIANGSPFHARILISKLFEVATRAVIIVSGSLTNRTKEGIDVYGDDEVISSAQKFLVNPETSLSILIQEGQVDGGNSSRFLNEIVNDDRRNGIIRLLMPQLNSLDTSVPHFMVSDQFGYRLETGADAHNFNTTAVAAIANFGDPQTGAELHTYFSELADSLPTLGILKGKKEFAPGQQFSI